MCIVFLANSFFLCTQLHFTEDDRSESPPMPCIPPPAPPAEYLEESASTLSGENSRALKGNTRGPHCIALYDYDSPHADDLSFKVSLDKFGFNTCDLFSILLIELVNFRKVMLLSWLKN